MQLITAECGQLRTVLEAQASVRRDRVFTTGLPAWDALAPGHAFQRGAVHELLSETKDYRPSFAAALMGMGSIAVQGTRRQKAKGERQKEGQEAESADPFVFRLSPFALTGLSPFAFSSTLAWIDPDRTLYPPALAAMGIPLQRLVLVHPATPADLHWATAECLRCKGIGATVAYFDRLSRIEARRLQLAAETGGGAGILLRTAGRNAAIYAAATRWMIRPHPGEPTIQRWSIQLIHGHGGRIGQTVFLEHDRENHTVRATAQLADRSRKSATGTEGAEFRRALA
jgi:hypothetical protein